MAKVVSFNTYKLKEGASVPEFLNAMEKLLKEFVSKQKGFISSKALVDGDTWADFTVFESMDDLNAFVPLCNKNELSRKCFSFMDFNTLHSSVFTVEQEF